VRRRGVGKPVRLGQLISPSPSPMQELCLLGRKKEPSLDSSSEETRQKKGWKGGLTNIQ